MTETVDRILELCRTIRCQTATERELQDALEVLLRANFPSVTREAQLGPKDIVDFLVDDVAVEVKVDGSPMAVTRQLQRYAQHERVQSLVLVTTRAKHRSVAGELQKKPVRVAWLAPF
jgi:hypothetical protein